MKKSIFILFLLSSLSACSLEQGESITPADLLFMQDSSANLAKNSQYKDLLKKYEKKGLPSISLIVYSYYDGLWVGNTGYARLEDLSRMRTANAVPLSEATCLFTAIGMMQLVEKGLVQLSATLPTYLDEKYLKNIPNADQITVRQLLNHTSGIRDYYAERNFLLDISNNHGESTDAEFFLDYLDGKSADFAAGSSYKFSHTNYLLLGLIAQSVTGGSFADFIDTYLINCFGLTHTFYKNQENYPNPTGRVNMYVDRLNDGKLENFSRVISQQSSQMSGHDGMYASIYDLFKVSQSLFGLSVLQLASLQEMAKEASQDSTTHGAGFEILTTPYGKAYGHKGLGYGSATYWFNFQEKGVSIIFSTNVGTKTASWSKQAVEGFWEEVQEIAMK